MLPSLAGVAIRPLRPDLQAEPDRLGVLIRRGHHQALTLSDTDPVQSPAPSPAILDFARFAAGLGIAQRRDAEAALASARGDRVRQADLIRIMLGLDLVDEARIVLQESDQDAPAIQG